MSTELEQSKATPKYEKFVDTQLDQVRRRIRMLDAGSYFLWFVAITLAYGLIISLIDRALAPEPGGVWGAVRLLGFFLYVVIAGFFLVSTGACLYRKINPYYAAKKLEESVPDAKNSVVNWLDLREEKLPPVIRVTLGQKAAKDLNSADPEKAVAGSKAVLLVSVVAGLVLALLILFLLGPNQFGSLMQRAFLPFRDVTLATRTYITLLQPQAGNVTVGLNVAVPIRIQVDGRVPKATHPDAPRLHFRYNQTETFVSQLLEPVADGTWTTTLLGDQIQSGLWYKITAGDAETPEYMVRVQTFPAVVRWKVEYKHRPYLKHLDLLVEFPNRDAVFPRIRAVPGTEVTVIAFTNRVIQSGSLKVITDKTTKDYSGEAVTDEPTALRFKFPVERTGAFQVVFTSKENESSSDQTQYPIDIIPDTSPNVVLTKPGKDVELAANDLLKLEGHADDDLGLKHLTLRMKVVEGESTPGLEPKPYRAKKSFRLVNGSYPTYLKYLDSVPLDKLKTDGGDAFPARPGTVIEYWLEAVDNSDYPNKDGNLGRSESFKVKIREPEKDAKKQQAKQKQAEQEQREHEKKQDQELDQQSKQTQQEKQSKQDKQAKADKKSGSDGEDKELQKQKEKLEGVAKRAQDQLDKEQKKGDAKPAKGSKTESKDGAKEKQQPGEAKSDSKGKEKQPESKDSGKKEKEQATAKNGEQKDQAKGKKEADPKTGAKGQEKEKQKEGTSSQAKGGEKGDAKSAEKKSGAEAKSKENGSKDSKGEKKTAADSPKSGEKKPDAGKGREREATLDEIAKLEKDAKQTDAKGDEALKELRRLSKDAADPKVREAAKEALNKAGKANGTPETKEKTDKQRTTEAKSKEPDQKDAKQSGEAKGGKLDKTAKDDGKSTADGSTGKAASQKSEDPKGPDADPELSKRAGTLQLEELKKKMTPELLKKAGISDAEWQQWLKDAQLYEDMLRKRGIDPDVRGKGSKLPSVAPRKVDTKVNANEDPLQNVRTLVPPELRDAYKLFTDPGAQKKKQ